VDPLNTEALGDAIFGLLTDEPRRRDLAQRGWQRSRAFSWSQTAKDMLAVYQRAAGKTVAAPAATTTVEACS
jgi:glycosyltransferase involved in cell wall biosynthesis